MRFAARRSQMDSVVRKTIVIVSNQRHNQVILLSENLRIGFKLKVATNNLWTTGVPYTRLLPVVITQLLHINYQKEQLHASSTPSSLYPPHSTSYCVLSLHGYSCYYIFIVFCKFSTLHQFYHEYRCTDGQVHQLQCHLCSYMWVR